MMFDSLKNKWKVSGLQLFLIISTFAIGGSLTGYAGKKVMNLLAIHQDWLWTFLYIVLITLLWPLSVILVSIPLGQFPFFRKYIKRIGNRLGLGASTPLAQLNKKTRIAIFASGAGSNAQKIIQYFRDHKQIQVALVVSNNPAAGVIQIAAKEDIPVLILQRERFINGDAYLPQLEEAGIGFIVLAGFLWKVPASLVRKYEKRIINIHPALLPQFGGKGMYGDFVHKAVIQSGQKQSGITIHYVDDVYDNGAVIFQATCPVYDEDTIQTLSKRIHQLEHNHYPAIIEEIILSLP